MAEKRINANTIALCALLLALLASFGCVSSGGWAGSSAWASGWGWQGLVAVAFAVVLSILALAYMAGSLLSDEKLKAWTRKEVGQAFYSMLIIIAVVALIGALDAALRNIIIVTGSSEWQTYIGNAVCCEPGAASCPRLTARACHVEVANDYLQMMYENLKRDAMASFMNHYFSAFFANLNIGMSARLMVHLGGFSWRPFAGLMLVNDFFSILFDLAIKNMMLVRVQQVFIDYFVAGFFPVMLSLGLVLRIFHFTRKLGGTLIALSLSVYYVFPLFYVLSDSVFFSFLGPWTGAAPPGAGVEFNPANPADATLPFSSAPLKFGDASYDAYAQEPINVMDYCGTSTAEEQQESLAPLSTFRSAWDAVKGSPLSMQARDFFKLGTGNAFGTNGPIASLAAVMVFTLILPFLGIMSTLATYKVLSPLLGGDVEIALISRLI